MSASTRAPHFGASLRIQQRERGEIRLARACLVWRAWFIPLRMSIDDIEETINNVSDDDRSWWPFLWMRPEQHARFSLVKLAALALLYGLPVGGLAAIAIAWLEPVSRAEAPVAAAGFPLMFFLFGSVFIAPMWNRRAERLTATRRVRDSRE